MNIVVSIFNCSITSALKERALSRLVELGFKPKDITLVEIPGTVEVPFAAQYKA